MSNSSDMSFCLQCGKVLSSDVEAQRAQKGIKKRKCNSCGKADELNNRYCIFCGSEVRAIAGRATNPAALEKFSQELAKVQPALTQSSQVEPVIKSITTVERTQQVKVAPPQKASSRAFEFLLLGLACGVGLAFVCGGERLAETYMLMAGDTPRSGLVAFLDRDGISVILESEDRTHYTVGQTGKNGTFQVADLSPGFYRLKFSFPGIKPLIDTLAVGEGRLNLLGFNERLVLPKSGEAQ